MRLNTLCMLGAYVSLAIVIIPSSVFGQCDEHNYIWTGEIDSYWSTDENWRHEEPNSESGECEPKIGEPSCDDWPYLDNNEPIYITVPGCCGQIARFGPGGAEVSGTGTFNIMNDITVEGGASFLQSGGAVSAKRLEIGQQPGSIGVYELQNGQLHLSNFTYIGGEGTGDFNQSGGTFTCDEVLELGCEPNANGTYTLSDGSLTTNWMCVGDYGTGTVIQAGGVVNIQGELTIGNESNSEGIYELHGGIIDTNDGIEVGDDGSGVFIQTGGEVNIQHGLEIADEPNGEGRYELRGGTINIADDIAVGLYGDGLFIVDGGTINGTSEEAALYVNTRKGSLIGQGDFNIGVFYYYEDFIGTQLIAAIEADFEPNCLARSENLTATQLAPEDFAGGEIPDVLPSSVFDINFESEANYCGEFNIAIFYDMDEVSALGGDENDLVILQETGPNSYKILTETVVLKEFSYVGAEANEFGKFAVAVVDMGGGWGAGPIVREWWTGIPGRAVNDLTANVNYPDKPSGRVFISRLEGPTNWLDDYGTRIRGYLHPPVDGNYTFWIASDANSELWLSTDTNAPIAYVSGWTNPREWTKYPEQQSSPIPLVKGEKYYIEVLHKAGDANDNVAVAWGEDPNQQVIDSRYLSSCCLDFRDLARFAAEWLLTGCNADNSWCSGADFNLDGSVLLDDLKLFAEHWLEGVEP